MKKKQVLSLLVLLVMTFTLLPGALAASAPKITRQPEEVQVVIGNSCVFRAAATGATGITWRICSPDGSEDFPFTNAPDHFRGLGVSGKNSDTLRLKNVPAEMDGWLVYCRYANKGGAVNTQKVPLIVLNAQGQRISATQAPAVSQEAPETESAGSYVPAAGQKTLATYGCSFQFIDAGGNYSGEAMTAFDFTDSYYNPVTRSNCPGGSLDVRVAADSSADIEYWIINGAPYYFDVRVKSFSLRRLTYPMTIEVVYAHTGEPQTLLSPDELQQKRTGERLLAESIDAKMTHVDADEKAGGGYFYDFDFTLDYQNRASGLMEAGGQADLKVVANIPKGKLISYWKFNEARLNFNSDVTWFLVENLNESMVYQPVFYTKATPTPDPTVPPTPVPRYTISCRGCTFSGGGYSGATSGAVPAGTRITVTPSGNSSLGYWSGSYSSGGQWDNVNAKSFTWTVKSNCSFNWHATIN